MKIRMRDGTGMVDLRYLVEDVDRHGNIRVYMKRQGHPKVRLRAMPGTDEFMSEYKAALAGEAKVEMLFPLSAAGSFRWLCERYFASAEFKALGPTTRRARRGILETICTTKGTKPYRMMEAQHVKALRDEKRDLPEAANGRVKALRQMFAWAIEEKIAQRNPARDVKYINSGSTGFHTWTEAEVDQFEAHFKIGTKPRLALALMLYTGARRSDVVQLGRQMERDGWLRWTEAKGRARKPKVTEVPVLDVLRDVLDRTPAPHLTFLVTAFGKPFTPAGFGNWFKARCREAGLPHCSAHGLRKAGATRAAENGASEHQLNAIFGWSSPKMAQHYTRDARRKKMAGDAMHLLAPAVPLSDAMRPGGTKKGRKAK